MTDLAKTDHVGRRRFLGGIGAGGLVAAAAVFGRPQAAKAAVSVNTCHGNHVCCDLTYAPTHTLSQCETGSYYVWHCSCNNNGFAYSCACCENYTHNYSTLYCT